MCLSLCFPAPGFIPVVLVLEQLEIVSEIWREIPPGASDHTWLTLFEATLVASGGQDCSFTRFKRQTEIRTCQ